MSDQPAKDPAQPLEPKESIEKHGILDKSLADLLQNNAQAKSIVMKAMNLNEQQMNDLVKKSANNSLMHMSIKELFKSGFVQQATSAVNNAQSQEQLNAMSQQVPTQQQSDDVVQVTPEQMEQLMQAMPNGQIDPAKFEEITGQTLKDGQMSQSIIVQKPQQKQNFLQKVKGLF